MYFAYGEEETDYLKKKDKRMAEVIDRIGHVERKVDTDLFSAARTVSALTSPSADSIRCQIVSCALVEICWPMMWCKTDENRSGSTVRSICPMRSMTWQSRLSFCRK